MSDAVPAMKPRLVSLATAVPAHVLVQSDVLAIAAEIFGERAPDFQRLVPVFENAQIERRHSCAPLAWFRTPHDLKQRNDLFIRSAVDLLVEAASKALDQAGLTPKDIDGVVCVSTSGIATPSLEALVMNRMGLRPDAERLPIFGLGCAGGVSGLARTAQLARAEPDKIYLFLVVELCTLNFQYGDLTKSNIVATALFGDGAAAAVIACRGDGPIIQASAEHTWPDTLDIMGWNVEADGLKVVFSRDIPSLARSDLRPVVDRFLTGRGLTRRDIDRFVCHPGGAKVIDALEDALEVPHGSLDTGRSILRDYGNMSAATVLFVLKAELDRRKPGGEGRALMTAFGPGFTASLVLLEAV